MKTPNNRQQEQRNHRSTEVVKGMTSSISDSMCLSSTLIRSHRVTMLTFLFQLQKTPLSSEDSLKEWCWELRMWMRYCHHRQSHHLMIEHICRNMLAQSARWPDPKIKPQDLRDQHQKMSSNVHTDCGTCVNGHSLNK